MVPNCYASEAAGNRAATLSSDHVATLGRELRKAKASKKMIAVMMVAWHVLLLLPNDNDVDHDDDDDDEAEISDENENESLRSKQFNGKSEIVPTAIQFLREIFCVKVARVIPCMKKATDWWHTPKSFARSSFSTRINGRTETNVGSIGRKRREKIVFYVR